MKQAYYKKGHIELVTIYNSSAVDIAVGDVLERDIENGGCKALLDGGMFWGIAHEGIPSYETGIAEVPNGAIYEVELAAGFAPDYLEPIYPAGSGEFDGGIGHTGINPAGFIIDNTSIISGGKAYASLTASMYYTARKMTSVLDYGMVGDGTTANDDAYALMSVAMGAQGKVFIPKGTYRFAHNPTAAEGIELSFEPGSMISVDGIAISAITKANPGEVTTSSAHGFSNGDKARFKDIGGMVELNYSTNGGVEYTVTVVSTTKFTIGVNTSAYTTYTSGGYSQHILTISGTCDVGLYQVFTGNGAVSFGLESIKEVYPQWFGAVGDGIANDQAAINKAATATPAESVLYFPPATGYATDGTITVPANVSVYMDADLVYTGSSNEPCLVIGSALSGTFEKEFRLRVRKNSQSDWTSESSIGIQLINILSSQVLIVNSIGFTIGVQCIGTNDGWFGYNTVNLDTIGNNKVGLDLVANHLGAYGWANENLFLGGKIYVDSSVNITLGRYGIRMRQANATTYKLNNNVFLKPCIEIKEPAGVDSIGFKLTNCRYNRFLGFRIEGTAQVYKIDGTDSWDNIFDAGYTSTNVIEDTSSHPASSYIPITRHYLYQPGHQIFDSGELSRLATYYDSAGKVIQIPGLQGFFYSNTTNYVYHGAVAQPASISDNYISLAALWGLGVWIDTKDVKSFVIRPSLATGAEVRVIVRAFDMNGALLDNSQTYINGYFADYPTWVVAWGGWYEDITEDWSFTVHADVKKVAVMFSYFNANPNLKGFKIFVPQGYASVHAVPSVWAETLSGQSEKNYAIASPTSGKWLVSRMLYMATPVVGGQIGWVCVNRIDTQIRVLANETATTIEVDSTTNMLANDIIGITLDDATIHWTTISGISDADTLVITSGIPAGRTSPVDANVFTNRWTTFGNNHLQKSFTWDPGNLIDGSGETKSETVTGAALGDFVQVSAPYDLQDMIITAYVQAADTIEVRLQNETGGTIDLASGAWKVRVIK